MPSFLSKVFGRKKDEKDSTTGSSVNKRSSLLFEGKYESASPTLSPSGSTFTDATQQPSKDKENGVSLALFRSRSRNATESLGSKQSQASSASVPHLTLNLPLLNEEKARSLGVVFETDIDGGSGISNKDIAECRLSPIETLNLVKACFDVIVSRGGLETLGLMHPHWYSASPEIQQKLLSLFILTLPSRKTISPPPVSFNAELDYTRTLHDIAAVLRWGLRHLRLENSSFGLSKATGWDWYASFVQKERNAAYPTTAFTKALLPLLPPAHTQLLKTFVEIVSSLAAHVETTGISGSKLAKLFGLWLLTSDRANADEQWEAFYKRWDTAGRALEHLFLAYVREEDSKNQMPLRLSELVKQYPYHDTKEGSTPGAAMQDNLSSLPRPIFSTRLYDTLFVRIDTRLPSTRFARPAGSLPAYLFMQTIKCATGEDTLSSEEAVRIWEDIKRAAAVEEEDGKENGFDYPELARILDDETLRLFSLASSPQSKSPVVTADVSPTQQQRRRSSSMGNTFGNGTSANNAKTAGANGNGAANSKPNSPSLTNWTDFSTLGFGETSLLGKDFASGLLDNDVESTSPQLTIPNTGSKKRRASSPARGRRSRHTSVKSFSAEGDDSNDTGELTTRLAQISMVQVDEAFFDFWSDALLDPVASNWPQFIVCHLKPSTFPVNTLVIEHSYSYPPPPKPVEQEQPTGTNASGPAGAPSKRRRASSPVSNLSATARKSSTLSPMKKRFSFFASVGSKNSSSTSTTTATGTSAGKPSKSPKIGEMGEVLAEADEPVPTITKRNMLSESPKEESKKLGLAVGGAGAAVVVATSDELPPVPIIDITPPTATLTTEFAPVATEPLNTDEDTEKPVPFSATSRTEDLVAIAKENKTKAKSEGEALPPAPEPVVLSGGTPGPQVALDSSEPVALAEASALAHVETPAKTKSTPVVKSKVEGDSTTARAVPEPQQALVEQAQHNETLSSHSKESSSHSPVPLPDISALPELVAAAAVDEDAEDLTVEEPMSTEGSRVNAVVESLETVPTSESEAPQEPAEHEPVPTFEVESKDYSL